jgi:hypothetical protein
VLGTSPVLGAPLCVPAGAAADGGVAPAERPAGTAAEPPLAELVGFPAMLPLAVWLALLVGELLLQAAPEIKTTAYPRHSQRLRGIAPSSFHLIGQCSRGDARTATLCK